MSVLAKFTTGTPATISGEAGAWTNATNAQADDTNFATVATARNAWYGNDFRGFDFSAIPDGSTIVSVVVDLVTKETGTANCQYRGQVYDNTTTIGAAWAPAASAGSTTEKAKNWTVSVNPTVAQLKSATFGVRIEATRTSTTANTESLDFVRVTVTYYIPGELRGTVSLKKMTVAGAGAGVSVASTSATAGQVVFDTVGPSAAGAAIASNRNLSWNHPPGGSNRAVLVGVEVDGASDASWSVSATCATNTMTPLSVVHTNNGTSGIVAVFGIANQGSGTLAIAVSVSGGGLPDDIAGGSTSFTGADLVSPFGAPQTAYGYNDTGTKTVTVPVTSMLAGFIATGNDILSTTSPATSRFVNNYRNENGYGAGNAAGSTAAGTGTGVAMAWSLDSSLGGPPWGVIVVEVIAASGGPGAIPMKKMTISGEGTTLEESSGTGAISMKKMRIYGADYVEESAATGAISMKKMRIQGFSVSVIAGLAGGTLGYFVDQSGNPILYAQCVGWGLLDNAGRWSGSGGGTWQQDITTFLTTRTNQGYNCTRAHILGTTKTGAPADNGKTWDGVDPFVSAGNPSSGLNEIYWERFDYMLDVAFSLGHTIEATATFTYDFGAGVVCSGWTTQQCTDWGYNLGMRYKNRLNLLWFFGDDYYSTLETQFHAVLDGLRNAGDTHKATIENYSEGTTSLRDLSTTPTGGSVQAWGAAHADYNLVYYYYPVYFGVEFAYQESGAAGPVPVIWGDGFYIGVSGDDAAGARIMRNMNWWAFASGARGISNGSDANKFWDSPANISALTSEEWFRDESDHVIAAFKALSGWHLLIPDYTSQLVTSGRGTRTPYSNQYWQAGDSSNYVCASKTPDGKLAVIYCATSFSITIDETKLGGAGAYNATRYDPASGATSSVTPGNTYSSAGWGTNSDGGSDWVLVLQGPGEAPEESVITGIVSFKKMTVAGSGAGVSDVTGLVSQKKMAVTAAGTKVSTASGGTLLKKMIITGSGSEVSAASNGPSLKKMTVSASGSAVSAGAGAVNLKKFTVSAAGDVTAADESVASGGLEMKKFTVSGAGDGVSVGSGVTKLKKATVSATGAGISVSSANVRLKKMSVSSAGTTVSVVSGGPRLKKMRVSVSGSTIADASVSMTLKKMTIFGFEGELAAFSGVVALKKMRVSGTGSTVAIASGGPILKKMIIASSGAGVSILTGAARQKKMRVSGAGAGVSVGTAAVILVKMGVSAAGEGISEASGVAVMKKMTIQGSSIKIYESSDMFIFSML